MSAQAKAKLITSALTAAGQRGCSPSAVAVLGHLVAASWPDPDGDGWVVNVGHEAPLTLRDLARAMGRCGVATARRAVAELEAAGLVEVERGAGRSPSIYRLAAQPTPCLEVPRALPQRCHGRYLRGATGATSEVPPALPQRDLYLTTVQELQDQQATAAAGAARGVEKTPPAEGAGTPDGGGDLDGLPAVKFERLRRAPAWFRGRRWIDSAACRRLAVASSITLEHVDAALAEAREAQTEGSLRPAGVAGFVIRRCQEPDAFWLERERGCRRAEAARHHREAIEHERRAAERARKRLVDEAVAETQRRALEAMGEAEADRVIDAWIREGATRFERDLLGGRDARERREYLTRCGRLAAVLEGVTA